MPSSENTTIAVSESTKQRLQSRGAKGDTYDEIVVELLEIAESVEDDSE